MQQTLFHQHLLNPTHIEVNCNIEFAFTYVFHDTIRIGTTTVAIPTCNWYMDTNLSPCYYNVYKAQNSFPPTKEWMKQQADFYHSLQFDDYITILTYSFNGDEMINHYMLYGDINAGTSNEAPRRQTPDYFVPFGPECT